MSPLLFLYAYEEEVEGAVIIEHSSSFSSFFQVAGGSAGRRVSYAYFKAFNQMLGNLGLFRVVVQTVCDHNPQGRCTHGQGRFDGTTFWFLTYFSLCLPPHSQCNCCVSHRSILRSRLFKFLCCLICVAWTNKLGVCVCVCFAVWVFSVSVGMEDFVCVPTEGQLGWKSSENSCLGLTRLPFLKPSPFLPLLLTAPR